ATRRRARSRAPRGSPAPPRDRPRAARGRCPRRARAASGPSPAWRRRAGRPPGSRRAARAARRRTARRGSVLRARSCPGFSAVHYAMERPAVGVQAADLLRSVEQREPARLSGGMRGDEERPGEPGGLGRRGRLDFVAGELTAAVVEELDVPLHRGPLNGGLRTAMIAGVTTT